MTRLEKIKQGVEIGTSILTTVAGLIGRLFTASTETAEAIVAAFVASQEHLEKAQTNAHAVREEEREKTLRALSEGEEKKS